MNAKNLRCVAAAALCAAILSVSTPMAAVNTATLPANELATAQALSKISIFIGDGTSYRLDDPLTRVEAAVMIVRMRGEEEQAKEAYDNGLENPFADITGNYAWAAPYVAWLYAKDVTKGIGTDAHGKPLYGTGNCTEKEYATFMLRALGYSDTAADAKYKWDTSVTFAKELGIYDKSFDDSKFDRGTAANMTYLTLAAHKYNSDKSLLQTFVDDGIIDKADAKPIFDLFEAEAPVAPVDMDGMIFTVFYDNGKSTPAGQFRDILGLDDADTVDTALYDRILTVEKTCNVSLGIADMPADELEQTLTWHVQAANEGLDLLIASPAMLAMKSAEGMLRDLNTVDGIDFTHSWWNTDANDALAYSGRQYMASSKFLTPESGGQVGLYYNADTVRALGFDDPADMAADGTWTVEAFLEIAQAQTKADRNAAVLLNDGNMPRYLYNACGETMIGRDDKNQLKFTVNQPLLMELAYMHGEIPRTERGDLTSYGDAPERLLNGELLFAADTVGSADRYLTGNTALAIVPMPKIDEDQAQYHSPVSLAELQVLALPVTQQDERIGALIENLNQSSAAADLQTLYTAQFSHGKNAEMLDLIMENTVIDLANTVSSLNGLIVDQLANNRSPASALRMVQALVEREIEKFNTKLGLME